MQPEQSSTKGERDRRLLGLHCVSLAPVPARGDCERDIQDAHAWRRMRIVATCVGAAVTLILTALVIISVYDYWPRPSLRPKHAHASTLAPMADGRTAAAAARGGYTRREDVDRIPFLVNTLQENRAKTKTTPSTPRPFFYRPSGPTAGPFRQHIPQSPLPRTWIDRYRSAQRLKNLEHVVQYLQRTARAQVADLAPAPSDRVAYTATWYNRLHEDPSEPSAFESSGGGDPLRGYRPHHPGDVNLLAEEPLRFSLQPAATVAAAAAANLHRVRFSPRRICYGSGCPSCNSLGNHFHPLIPPDTGEAERMNPYIFNGAPEERASSVSNRKVIRPSFLPKPRFRPKMFLSEDLTRPIVRSLLPNRNLKSRFHFIRVTTTTISPPIRQTTEQFDFGAPASNNIEWYSRSEVSMTSPSLNSLPSSFSQDNTLPMTTPPSKPFIFTYMLNPAMNVKDFGGLVVAPTRIPNEPEIIKFKAEDAKVHKNKISTPRIFESDRDNIVESVITTTEETNDAGKVVGDILRTERGSTMSENYTSTSSYTPIINYSPTVSYTSTVSYPSTVSHSSSITSKMDGSSSLAPQINGHYRSLHAHYQQPPAAYTKHESTTQSQSAFTPSEALSEVTVSPTTTASYVDVEGTLRHKYIAIDRGARHQRRTSTGAPPRATVKESSTFQNSLF